MTAPYDQLFIYEIEGDARAALDRSCAHYLGLWLEEGISYVFFSQPAEKDVDGLLGRGEGLRLLSRHQLTYEQWQGGLKMEPLLLPGLMVAPAWQERQPPPDCKLLRLDPGLVFGNGLHPTTRHCLELLIARAQEGPLGRVLDLGCGTGILGLAAALLGAERVLAVDLNPLCVSTAQNNARLNNLPLIVREGQAQDFLSGPAEVLLANLHWEVQQRLLADEALLADKPDLILSGLLRSQRGPLEDRLVALGYGVIERREAEQTWFTLRARRP